VRMLWQHDPASPIGSWISMSEDARGLKVRGQLNLAVARAREALALMREGSVDGLSIGFRVKRASKPPRGGIRKLLELDLWEVSLVTFPMLPQARVSAAKRSPAPPQVTGEVATLMRRAAALMK
jgi:HK97 family phage prohead protease